MLRCGERLWPEPHHHGRPRLRPVPGSRAVSALFPGFFFLKPATRAVQPCGSAGSPQFGAVRTPSYGKECLPLTKSHVPAAPRHCHLHLTRMIPFTLPCHPTAPSSSHLPLVQAMSLARRQRGSLSARQSPFFRYALQGPGCVGLVQLAWLLTLGVTIFFLCGSTKEANFHTLGGH